VVAESEFGQGQVLRIFRRQMDCRAFCHLGVNGRLKFISRSRTSHSVNAIRVGTVQRRRCRKTIRRSRPAFRRHRTEFGIIALRNTVGLRSRLVLLGEHGGRRFGVIARFADKSRQM